MSGPEINRLEVDMAMLQSMATSFRARMDFSFNADDMADLLDRIRAALPDVQAIVADAAKAEREACLEIINGYGQDDILQPASAWNDDDDGEVRAWNNGGLDHLLAVTAAIRKRREG